MKTINDDGSIAESLIRAGLETLTRFETLPTGERQAMIEGTERRTIPTSGLKAKRRQTDKPMELEQAEKKEPRLFQEMDCPRCEETFMGDGSEDYCPKCRKNMNRIDIGNPTA